MVGLLWYCHCYWYNGNSLFS